MAKYSLALIAVFFAVATAVAESPAPMPRPRYLILPPAGGIGYLVPSESPRYSYGWFGVQPRKTFYRHFGYHRDYTQWKAK